MILEGTYDDVRMNEEGNINYKWTIVNYTN